MSVLLYKFFFILSRIRKRNLKKNNFRFACSNKMIGYIEAYFNIIIPRKYDRELKNGLNRRKRDQRIIVSLTSYPGRINTVWIAIESLFRQSLKPDKIILWLAHDQFLSDDSLPKRLMDLKNRGLIIKYCDNLLSHKKYYYTMQEYPNDLIILVDDDMIYPNDVIKKLYNMHKDNPNDICTINCQKIVSSIKSPPSTWKNPGLNERICSSSKVQIFSGSGSLYIPNCLDKEVFDKEKILKYCPFADDLWLTIMAYKKGTKITSLSRWRSFPIGIYGSEKDCLYNINVSDGRNDVQWENLIKSYPEVFDEIERKFYE